MVCDVCFSFYYIQGKLNIQHNFEKVSVKGRTQLHNNNNWCDSENKLKKKTVQMYKNETTLNQSHN